MLAFFKRLSYILIKGHLRVKHIDGGGGGMTDIVQAYEMNHSTIVTIFKGKTHILGHVKISTPMQSTIITKD